MPEEERMAIETAAVTSLPCCASSAFFLLMGLALTVAGAQKFLLVQKIENTPTSKVRSAAVGLVELFGAAKCKDDLISPVSKAKCVYWHVRAEYYKSGKRSSGWHTFFSESSSPQFYLEDDTGKMLIDPKGGEVSIPSDFTWTGHLSDKTFFGLIPQKQLDAKVLAYLQENPSAKAAFNSYGGHNLRMSEFYIAEDDNVYILGSAQPLEGAAQSEIAHENLVVRKSKSDNLMFISDSPEKKFSGWMKITALAMLFVGLVITVAAGLSFLGAIGSFFMLLGS